MDSQNSLSTKYQDISVVDVETIEMLKQHAQGNAEILKDLFDSFIPEAEEQIAELKQAVNIKHKEQIKISAHGLSGISGTIGALQLKVLMSDMENYAKKGEYEKSYQLIEYVDQFFDNFIRQAKKYIQE
ncbi:MAG: Hpt domain-containing protein [Bacteroidota bacterium]